MSALHAPLSDLEDWDEFFGGRYKEGKSERRFASTMRRGLPGVAEFYRQNQSVAYILGKEQPCFILNRGQKRIWEAAEFLNTLVDDGDRDKDLTQIGLRSRPQGQFVATVIRGGWCVTASSTI